MVVGCIVASNLCTAGNTIDEFYYSYLSLTDRTLIAALFHSFYWNKFIGKHECMEGNLKLVATIWSGNEIKVKLFLKLKYAYLTLKQKIASCWTSDDIGFIQIW